jgi:hypothetical protein
MAVSALPASGAETVGGVPSDSARAADDDRETRRELEWFGLRSGIGYSHVNLTTFLADDAESVTADFVPTRLSGPAATLAASARLWFVSIGARGSIAFFSDDSRELTVDDLSLWSIDGELVFHLLSGYALEPYIMLAAGYSELAGIEDAVPGLAGAYAVRGYNARLGIGLDWFVSDNVSLGVLASAEALFLTRPGVSAFELMQPEQVETVGQARARLLEGDGSSIGTAFTISAGPGIHF